MNRLPPFPLAGIARPDSPARRGVRQIALYGKGGIGKSTVASNLSAALAERGFKVLQMGCDPKADSVTSLVGGRFIPTILDRQREIGHDPDLVRDLVVVGFNGVLCAESGGPLPGQGCAGRGVLVALEMLAAGRILEAHGIDFALYDVLGDVVCGGFAQPLRKGFVSEVYLVTSAEMMALYAANNIARALASIAGEQANVRLAGIIHNRRNVAGELEMVEEFAARLGTRVVMHVPRDAAVQIAESQGKTVIEALPQSAQAEVYRDLAKRIVDGTARVIPTPYPSPNDVRELVRRYQQVGAEAASST